MAVTRGGDRHAVSVSRADSIRQRAVCQEDRVTQAPGRALMQHRHVGWASTRLGHRQGLPLGHMPTHPSVCPVETHTSPWPASALLGPWGRPGGSASCRWGPRRRVWGPHRRVWGPLARLPPPCCWRPLHMRGHAYMHRHTHPHICGHAPPHGPTHTCTHTHVHALADPELVLCPGRLKCAFFTSPPSARLGMWPGMRPPPGQTPFKDLALMLFVVFPKYTAGSVLP